MSETLMRAEICCDPSCENYNKEQLVPLTDEEIAEAKEREIAFEQRQLEIKAEAAAVASLKASAKAKLIAGQPLTAEEADTLVI